MTMALAMYKGPADDWLHKLSHWAVCVFTLSRYSHCELVIDGLCHSSSFRDGGVRVKKIDLTSGHWEVFPLPEVPGREEHVRAWFARHQGEGYDWAGIARFVLPALLHRPKQWFCSEACAAALGIPGAADFDPQDLLDHLIEPF